MAARVGVNQARTLAHADEVADAIDAKVVRLWKRALRLIALKPLPVDVRTQLGAILREIQTLTVKGLDAGLRQIAKRAHTAAREEVLAEAPRAVIATALTLAAPARPDLTEARRLNPEQRAQVEAQLFPALDHDETTAIITRPTNGLTWQARIAAQSALAPPEQLANIVIQGISQGQTIQAMARTMLPAVQGVRTSARRVARTEGMRVAHEARMDCYSGLGDLVAGYQIHATMDWRVRPHHAARNGTVYYVRPKPGQQSTTHMPRPPLEEDGTVAHNCRCYLTPVLDVDPDIENNPAARALFTDNDHKLVQDPNVYSDWFANASDQERRWAVGARRLSAITAGLPSGQAPTWAHFIDPTTGQLLQLERLTAETPARREARMNRVAEVLAERERLARQVQRFGYLTAEDGGEPLPVADLTPPAPHPYTSPETPTPATPEPLPLPAPVEQDRIDAEQAKFSREAGKGGAFQGEAVKADPTEYVPFQWAATRFPFKLEGPTGVAVSHEVYKPVLRPGAKLDRTSDSALKREWQELMEKDKLTMADLQYAEEKTTLAISPDGTRVLLATPEQAAKAMGLKPAKVREYDQIAAATWRIQFGKEILASWQEKADQAEEIWRQTREMEGPPPTRHPEGDQGNNRAWIVDGIVFRVYDESEQPKLTRGVKTAALSLWRDKQAENLRWAVNIPIDHRAWKKEIKAVADQVESLEKKLRGKVDRFGAALDVMTPTGPQVTAPAPPPPQVNVVRGEAEPMPDGADDIAMDRYGEVVNLAQRAFGKGTKSLPLFNALGELSGEQMAKVALHVNIDPATLPEVLVGTSKRRDYLYAQIIKRQSVEKMIDVEAIASGVDPVALQAFAEQGWKHEMERYNAEKEVMAEMRKNWKFYSREFDPKTGKKESRPWPARNSPVWDDHTNFPFYDEIVQTMRTGYEWSGLLFGNPEEDLSAAAGENVKSSDPNYVLWDILMRSQAGEIKKPDKLSFFKDQIYLVRDDPSFAYDPERPVVPVSTEPFNWDDDAPAPAEPPMQPAEEPERVWDDEEGEWVTAPTAVATPDPDPWDDDPFARGAVAPPLAAEQPEPDEERRWEDEESDANWEPAGAASGGDPWDFPAESEEDSKDEEEEEEEEDIEEIDEEEEPEKPKPKKQGKKSKKGLNSEDRKRLEEAVRLERRALRAGITLGEAFGAVPHRCLYLNPMRRPIHESVLSGRGIRVNREAGTIANVKILGLVSENGRQYLPAAIQAAKKLYEGVHVNIDHPKDSPDQQRSAYDRFGKLTRIRWVEGEGLYGDLVYLKTHPMAERICEAAERMPDAFGMSHNAQGEGEENKDGVFVVSKIVEVRHVDLVADPATTKSLSESKMLEATAGPFANNWPLEPEPKSETQYKINNKRFDERHVFLTKNQWERKGDTYVNKWNPKAKLTGKEVMLLSDDSWDALKGKIASGYMEAESFTKYDKWKVACQSKHGDCSFKRDGAVVIATDKAGKKVGSFKPSSTFNSGGQGEGPPGKGTMEATGAKQMDTVEIVSQLKDLLDQLASSLGGSEEMPSEEAYEEKPAMEAEDGEIPEEDPSEEDMPEAMIGRSGMGRGKRLNFSDYEDQVSRMSNSQIDGAIADCLATLKSADAIDKETGSDDGGYYRDQLSVLRKERTARMSGKKQATEAYGDPEEDDKEKPAMEARQTKAIRNARKLCEAVGLKPSRDLLQDLANMPKETAARQVQRLALAQKSKAPRSGSYMTEGRTGATDNGGIPTGPALFTWLAN
jgi:SPP1 gp7 family putative phage head morphogenesis protein